MRQKSGRPKERAEKVVRDIRRATRRRFPYWAGETGQPGRFSGGLLLRRSHRSYNRLNREIDRRREGGGWVRISGEAE